MAVLKHIASKNADYTAAERYLIFQHDERSGRMLRDEEGYPMLRERYLLEGVLCDPACFAAECRKMNKNFRKNKGKKEIKTHHYMISFDPKDREEPGLTIEKAQAMGMAFAAEHFPGHQMLVCTHEDGHNGAGNIHVHIVLNSLRIQDVEPLPYEQRRCDGRAGYKHNCTRDFMAYLRNDLMQMCREAGLHQVELRGARRRVTNAEYRAGQCGQEALDRENLALAGQGAPPKKTKFETEKEKLRQAIQAAISESQSPEEFQSILLERYGIQVRESRGRWSYLPQGRTKPITGRKLGDAFEKGAVIEAIQAIPTSVHGGQKLGTNRPQIVAQEGEATSVHGGQKSGTDCPQIVAREGESTSVHGGQKLPEISGIERVIQLEGNAKAENSEAYAQWIKLHNLKEQAKTFCFMTEHGLLSGTALDEEYALLTEQFRAHRTCLKGTERRLKELKRQLRLMGQYYKGKTAYQNYCKSGKQADLSSEQRAEVELYENAVRELREIFGGKRFPSLGDLKREKAALSKQREEEYTSFRAVRSEWMELGKVIQNRDSFLAKQPEQQKEKRI